MTIRTRTGAAVVVLAIATVLLVTGCGGSDDGDADEPTGSDETSEATDEEPEYIESVCDKAMSKAADEPDSAAAEPLIRDTLTVCETATKWLNSLERYPGAMGLTDDAEIEVDNLRIACAQYETFPVCRDAIEQGRFPARSS